MVSSPSAENNFYLTMRLAEEKATVWAPLIESIPGQGKVPHQAMEGIIGKISFSQTVLLGGTHPCSNAGIIQQTIRQIIPGRPFD